MFTHQVIRQSQSLGLRACRAAFSTSSKPDVIILGAGHNGLVAATLLARQGLQVQVHEAKATVGGACKTEYPFKNAPGLGTSTGAYLLGVMPPELLKILNVDIPLKRRDPHYFLPTTGDRYLLFGSDMEAMKAQFLKFFSHQDWRASRALQTEIEAIRDDIAPTWLQQPLSLEQTADKFVRPSLQQTFIDLCQQPVAAYLDRFNFKSPLLKSMYAVTDGFSGLNGSWQTPGTGMNFLVHNMCRLPGADGTWMVVEGGMGTVTQRLAEAAQKAGAVIKTNSQVEQILIEDNTARGVRLSNGQEITAKAVMVNADPFALRQLAGSDKFSKTFNDRLDNMKRDGTTMKVNMALEDLPKFTCLPERRGQHHTTIHLLPDEEEVEQAITDGFADVQNGRLPEFPTIEWYIHTTVDPTLQDKEQNHNSALFVQWVPYTLANTTWEEQEAKYVKHLLRICDRFAPGTSDLVVDTFTLTPPKIESHFGITRGHIHHIDNAFGFDQRFPYALPVDGLYSASAGTHPGGSVVGCAGHNAAIQLLHDFELQPEWNVQVAA